MFIWSWIGCALKTINLYVCTSHEKNGKVIICTFWHPLKFFWTEPQKTEKEEEKVPEPLEKASSNQFETNYWRKLEKVWRKMLILVHRGRVPGKVKAGESSGNLETNFTTKDNLRDMNQVEGAPNRTETTWRKFQASCNKHRLEIMFRKGKDHVIWDLSRLAFSLTFSRLVQEEIRDVRPVEFLAPSHFYPDGHSAGWWRRNLY